MMGTVLIGDDLWNHPVAKAASLSAIGAWVTCLCWCELQGREHVPHGFTEWLRLDDALVDELAALGFFEDSIYGWRVVQWEEISPRPRRRYIPAPIRREVMDRDGHTCVFCGATSDLTLDHIVPWSLNGPDTVENLRVLCRSCNSRRGAPSDLAEA